MGGVTLGNSALASYRLLQRDGAKIFDQFKKSATILKDVETFKKQAARIESPDDFFKNQKLMRFALSAYGLDADISSLGRIKKVMTSDLSDENSLANRMTDPRYQELAKAFDFQKSGTAKLGNASFLEEVAQKYIQAEFEKSIGRQNPAVREALYFARNIGKVGDAYGVLGDRVLRSVVTYELGLPDQIAVQSVMKQKSLIDDRLDISKFKGGVSKTTTTSSVNVAEQTKQDDLKAIDRALNVNKVATAQATTTVDMLAKLVDDYANLASITSLTGPLAAEIPVQEAAVPTLLRQQGLSDAAGRALNLVSGYLNQMDELVQAALDPDNSANIATYQSQFASLVTDITNAINTEATYNGENLLDGSLGDITAQVKSDGSGVTLHGQDMTSFLSTISAANAAFQSSNFTGAAGQLDTAGDAAETVSTVVGGDIANFNSATGGVSAWVATLNTTELYQGSQTAKAALEKSQEIQVLLIDIRNSINAASDPAYSGDRTALNATYQQQITSLQGLINAADVNGENLLTVGTGSSYTYNVIGANDVSVRGQDFNSLFISNLTGDLLSAGNAQTLKNALENTVDPGFEQAQRQLNIDSSPVILAADTFDARGQLDQQYRDAVETIDDAIKKSYLGSDNLLENYTTSISVYARTVGQSASATAFPTFRTGVYDGLNTGSGQLPGNLSTAMTALNDALFEARRVQSNLTTDGRSLTKLRADVVTTGDARAAEEKAKGPTENPVVADVNSFTEQFILQFLVKKDAGITGSSAASSASQAYLSLFQNVAPSTTIVT
jgi:hypothetical protein